jgi:hypothetical protein
MKKLLVALMLLAMSSLASAQPYIGLFADADGTHCYADMPIGAPVTIHVMALIEDIPAITAAEFRIDNFTGSPGYPTSIVTQTWNSPLTVGTIDYGFSIAFTVPKPGPVVALGTIEYLTFDPTWIGADYVMTTDVTLDSGNLVVVDAEYITIPVGRGTYTFNCTNPELCPCYDETIPTQDASWGSIKALY